MPVGCGRVVDIAVSWPRQARGPGAAGSKCPCAKEPLINSEVLRVTDGAPANQSRKSLILMDKNRSGLSSRRLSGSRMGLPRLFLSKRGGLAWPRCPPHVPPCVDLHAGRGGVGALLPCRMDAVGASGRSSSLNMRDVKNCLKISSPTIFDDQSITDPGDVMPRNGARSRFRAAGVLSS